MPNSSKCLNRKPIWTISKLGEIEHPEKNLLKTNQNKYEQNPESVADGTRPPPSLEHTDVGVCLRVCVGVFVAAASDSL